MKEINLNSLRVGGGHSGAYKALSSVGIVALVFLIIGGVSTHFYFLSEDPIIKNNWTCGMGMGYVLGGIAAMFTTLFSFFWAFDNQFGSPTNAFVHWSRFVVLRQEMLTLQAVNEALEKERVAKEAEAEAEAEAVPPPPPCPLCPPEDIRSYWDTGDPLGTQNNRL